MRKESNVMKPSEKRLYLRVAQLAFQSCIAQGCKGYQNTAQRAFNFADAFMNEYKNRVKDDVPDFY